MSTHTLTRTVSPTYRACEIRSVDSLLWHIYISVCCLLGPKPGERAHWCTVDKAYEYLGLFRGGYFFIFYLRASHINDAMF